MSLTACKECQKPVSTEAKSCPHCGAKVVQNPGCFSIALVVLIGGAIMISVISPSRPTAPPPPPKSPDQIAAEARQEARFQKVAIASALVKRALREPESVKWETILSNDDATVICFAYRARNGFGGMAKEHLVVLPKSTSRDGATWNKNCTTKPLHDMSHVEYALRPQ